MSGLIRNEDFEAGAGRVAVSPEVEAELERAEAEPLTADEKKYIEGYEPVDNPDAILAKLSDN